MGSKDSVVRFRAGAADGRHSTTWRVFATHGKSDVYLLSRPLGELAKVSLHQSGRWRTAFTNQDVADRYLAPDEDRSFDKFSPPLDEVAPGWVQAYAVLLPDSELQHYEPEQSTGAVVELASPGAGRAIYVSVLLGTPDASPFPRSGGQQEVGSFLLADARQVLLLAEPTTVPAHLQEAIEHTRRSARQAALDRGLDLAAEHPVHPLICADDDGSRFTVEVAAWSARAGSARPSSRVTAPPGLDHLAKPHGNGDSHPDRWTTRVAESLTGVLQFPAWQSPTGPRSPTRCSNTAPSCSRTCGN